MLARLSPRNAASTFGASIEQALQTVEARLKRLEDQPGHAPLEEALRGADARIQRLERERDGQARLYERVEALLTSRINEVKQSVNRSLEVIVDKARGEIESCRAELLARDAELRKSLAAELDGVRELRRHADAFAALEARLLDETKATKDVCMATTLQLGAVEGSLSRLRGAVAALPVFLWSVDLNDAPFRRPDLGEIDPRLQPAGSLARGRRSTSGDATRAALEEAGPGSRLWPRGATPAAASTGRRRSPDSASTDAPSPGRREGATRGALSRAALAAAAAAEADADASLEGGAELEGADAFGPAASRRKRLERRDNRAALTMASIAGEALMDSAVDRRWAAAALGERPWVGEA